MYVSGALGSENRYDAVFVGAGIMSATLAVLLHELDPELRLLMVERLEAPALESSSALNNAGTGHAANCELNYTPLCSNGKIAIDKALSINNAFEQSLEFWASLTEKGKISPHSFINCLPHISFVWGKSDVAFLKQRFQELSALNEFSSMEWSHDFVELAEWIPLVMEGRSPRIPIAGTRIRRGTDIDFGALTNSYLELLALSESFELKLSTEVVDLQRIDRGRDVWEIELLEKTGCRNVASKFVFLGAGGKALSLLQNSGIPEGDDYAGFPVSGQWLVCSDSELTQKHNAKVYGKAKVGAPPMSVPHLDSRWINGKRSMLFGPFAGFSTKFLKNGSTWDLFGSIRRTNILPMMDVGLNNFDLIKYLVDQLRLSEKDRLESLREFLPYARQKDWSLAIAGQRVQIVKNTSQGGILQMGTEVVTSADGSLAALLGASPGASTAITIMLEVLERCWREEMAKQNWQQRIKLLLPSHGKDLNTDLSLFRERRQRSDVLLDLM